MITYVGLNSKQNAIIGKIDLQIKFVKEILLESVLSFPFNVYFLSPCFTS